MIDQVIDALIRLGGIVACGGIIVGSVCRVDKMGWKKTKLAYFALYMSYGAWAMGTAIDLWFNFFVDWYTYFGLMAVFGHMILTMKEWKHGPPKEVRTDWSEL